MGIKDWFRRKDDLIDPGLPEPLRELAGSVRRVLAPLDTKGAPGLAGRAGAFVATGADPSVLTELGQVDRIWWDHFYQAEPGPFRELYQRLAQTPPDVGLRWARLAEAAWTQGLHRSAIAPLAGSNWTEAFLVNLADSHLRAADIPLPISWPYVEAMVRQAGADPEELWNSVFTGAGAMQYAVDQGRSAFIRLPGYGAAAAQRAARLQLLVAPFGADDRHGVVQLIHHLEPAELARFAPLLAALATDTSTTVRSAATPVLDRLADRGVPQLRELATTARPEGRLIALRLLMDRADGNPELIAFARETAAADRAPSVQALPQQWDAREEQAARPEAPPLPIPDLPQIDWRVEWSDELAAVLDAAHVRATTEAGRRARQFEAMVQRQTEKYGTRPSWGDPPAPPPRDLVERLRANLVQPAPPSMAGRPPRQAAWLFGAEVLAAVPDPALTPVALTKLLFLFDRLLMGHRAGLSGEAVAAYNSTYAATGHPTLLDLEAMLDDIGVQGAQTVLGSYRVRYGESLAAKWDDDAVWPFIARHLESLLADRDRRDWDLDEGSFFRALGTLPQPPAQVIETLFEIALGTRRSDRLLAQEALAKHPGKETRIAAALADGKGETRATAASWLARIGDESSIPALEKAVAKEKLDLPKGAMLDALQAMGRPVERYLDRDALAKQGEAAVGKPVPKGLDWFPWDAVPQVHWADNGEEVPTTVLRWLVLSAAKAKSAEPNAVLRKYCGMFDPGERERLGQFVLEAWIAEDLRPIDLAAATALATSRAQQMYWLVQAAEPDDRMYGWTFEQTVAHYLAEASRQPAGSAVASKGVLAVAAACAGDQAVAPVRRYLEEWYGMRAAQCKALISMLAWIDRPSAIQQVLAVGSRFRTKSIQDEATKQIEALAERKGWTLDELTDRTVPTAGFDEFGILPLSYGDRVFTGHLLPDLGIELRSPEGKVLKTLPQPRQSDDAEKVKESKKALTAARKELKAIATLQGERLYEALCTGRSWPAEDWQRYLAEHPLLRQLVQRLVWRATDAEGDAVAATFRPLDDGTLTDVADEALTLDPDWVVTLAHDSNLPAETVRSWAEHLSDYEISPLFQQFGKDRFTLPEDRRLDRTITDFTGHLVEAFALRNRAGKLGYTRGPAEDAGWFYSYEKRFPTLGITTVIAFTGNPLPETNRTVALTELRFERRIEDAILATGMALGDVPPVLLAEAWSDLRSLAALGPGFDPDWERKSEY